VESWLVGVGFVVYGGALLGRLVCEWFGHVDSPGEPPDLAPPGPTDRGGPEPPAALRSWQKRSRRTLS
jgi:membrane protein